MYYRNYIIQLKQQSKIAVQEGFLWFETNKPIKYLGEKVSLFATEKLYEEEQSSLTKSQSRPKSKAYNPSLC